MNITENYNLKSEIEEFKNKGYIIKRILDEKQCDDINKYVEQNDKNAYYEKYTGQKFGYKFDLNESLPINNYIYNNIVINNFAKEILGKFDFSVIKSFYKSAFMAREIEYHQEYSYNSHHPSRGNWQDYIQIFIALDDHSLENACLKIIPESHKLGLLPFTNIVNSNLEHKRAVEYFSLKNAFQKFGILNCELKKGEAVFFNHLIIHGSQNNNSHLNRRALVTTIYKFGLEINTKNYKKFEEERKNFTIDELNKKILVLKNELDELDELDE